MTSSQNRHLNFGHQLSNAIPLFIEGEEQQSPFCKREKQEAPLDKGVARQVPLL